MDILRICGLVTLVSAILSVGVLGLHRSASAALAPGRPIAKVLEPGTVSLDWDDVPRATGYELRYRDSEWNVLLHDDVHVTMEGSNAVIRSLPGGSEYAFSVRTRVAGGYRSNWSEPVYANPLPVRAVPATPDNLKVVKRERGSVTLEWQGVNSADSYQVAYWRTSEAGAAWIILPDEGIRVSFDPSGGTGAVVIRLPDLPGQLHDFAVRAVNAAGVSGWSDVVQAPAFLQAPQNLSGWYQAPGQVVLTWQDMPAASGYEIIIWYDFQTVFQEWVLLPTDDIAVSLAGAQALVDLGTNHSDRLLNFSIRALNDLGKSPWSSAVAVGPILQVPGELTGRLLDDGSIALDWLDVPIVDAYEVRFLLGGASGSQWVILPAAGVEVSFDGSGARLEQLPDYAAYAVQVRATKEHSLPSGWSEVLVIAKRVSAPRAAGRAASGGSLPSGPSKPSTEVPEGSGAPPPSGPSSGGSSSGGSSSGGPSTSGTVTETRSTSRDRSRSRQSTSTGPRVWLQNIPTTLAKDDVRLVTLIRENIPAGFDVGATVGVNVGGTGKVAFVAYTDSDGKPDPDNACHNTSTHGYHETVVDQPGGGGRFYLVGCKAGSTTVSLAAHAPGSREYPLKVVERTGD